MSVMRVPSPLVGLLLALAQLNAAPVAAADAGDWREPLVAAAEAERSARQRGPGAVELPFSATFLVFADYMRPPIRLAALSHYRSIFVFTHDSIAVGEDGPTHEPVEQTMSLRLIPNLTVIRPADANETADAWRAALTLEGPVVLVFSRQDLAILDRSAAKGDLSQGGYILVDSDGDPDLLQRDPRIEQPFHDLQDQDVAEAVQALGTGALGGPHGRLDYPGTGPVVELAGGYAGHRGRGGPAVARLC